MSAAEIYSTERLIDVIFVNLMENGYGKDTKSNGYIIQFIDKFKLFRIKSPTVCFEINIKHLNLETIRQIDSLTKGCNTEQEKYFKLNGLFTEVIARIAKQAEPIILSLNTNEDAVLLRVSLNQIRDSVSFKWRLVKN